MDAQQKTLLKQGALGAVILLVLVVGLLYATDYGVEATITDKGRDNGGNYIIATTELGGVDVKRYLPTSQWLAIQQGNFVIYNIQSGTIEVYASEGGSLIWKG